LSVPFHEGDALRHGEREGSVPPRRGQIIDVMAGLVGLLDLALGNVAMSLQCGLRQIAKIAGAAFGDLFVG
jgi:hypothetical protein